MTVRSLVPALLAAALAGLLGRAWLGLPEVGRVAPLVRARLEASGVDNPVTAVLLNFRGYDTLLELAVLLLAAMGALLVPAGGPAGEEPESPEHGPVASEMLAWYIRRLAPLVLVFGGYLWWTGSSHPGGAFQAGAVLAGGAALLLLSRIEPVLSTAGLLRPALVAGLAAFLAGALIPLALGRAVLAYPEGWSKAFIAGIEGFAVVSIAAALTVLMAGAAVARGRESRR